uniref:Thioredoxin 1 n=1 Tax=Tetraselmis sp. GSL018 TaxID=582737 RepID=A0A061SNK1_9CHLO|eukprot:CAMPEP_0177579370 /NCGR_PEP_ID=MMETSP0419_2-20121207/916_1 /TAXON_ID=582737 /ORGANISM="Tetraselmis sp., Strain GSL018" /LENGTH=198 /DNA_ID=CAMNT_0019068017 /DNA_START=102 /DNA_END=698 /DNA_ORIENTATION=-
MIAARATGSITGVRYASRQRVTSSVCSRDPRFTLTNSTGHQRKLILSPRSDVKVSASRDEQLRELEEQKKNLQVMLTTKEEELHKDDPVEEQDTQLLELTKDDFHEFINSSKNLVVVDFFTDWCGPCKMIYPKLVELNDSYPDVAIVKFNCNKYNKELGKELGIRVAPTFHLYKEGSKVAEMTGAKVDKLTELIETYK